VTGIASVCAGIGLLTIVLIKRDGKWLYLARQLTPITAASGVPSAADASGGENGVNADWAQVRGKRKRELKDQEGRTGRATKEIQGNQETITYFDHEGKVVYAQTVEVKLERVGNVRLFTYSNGKVLAGPNNDQEVSPKPFSYVYTTDGQMFSKVQYMDPAAGRPQCDRPISVGISQCSCAQRRSWPRSPPGWKARQIISQR
jgi:hypothetical protein